MSSNQRAVGTDLTGGSIMKTLVKFVVPIFLTNFIQELYNIVDLIVIGQFAGSAGTVGVSNGGEIVGFLTFFCMGFANAGQVYIAQLCGRKNFEAVKRTIGTLLTMMILSSVVFGAFALTFCRPLLQLINTPAGALDQAYAYMMITTFGLPFIFCYNAICGILRGMGESRRPLNFIIVAAITNVVLDYIFVAFLDMSSAGTALATIIAQIVSCVLAFRFLYVHRADFNFDFLPQSFVPVWDHLKVLLKVGFPMAVQSACIHLSLMFCNAQINSYGMVTSATNSIGNKVVRFSNLISNSMNTGAAAMIGQNLGAKQYDRAKQVVFTALRFAMALAVFNCIVALTAPKLLFGLFSSDPEVLQMSVNFMRISCVTFLLSCWMGPFGAMVNGSGFAALNFLIGILDGVVLRISISLFLAHVMHMGVYAFFWGNSLARLAPCVISTVYFFSGKWKTRKLLGEKK